MHFLPFAAELAVCLEALSKLERTCCCNDGGRPTAEVDRQFCKPPAGASCRKDEVLNE